MPLKLKGKAPDNIKPEDQDPDQGFGLKNFLAGGVRAVSGLVSGIGALSGGVTLGMGNLLGAGVAGAGEGAAQMIEEGDVSAPFSEQGAKRVAVEAALGAVPLGKLFKAGKFLPSALRGGLFSGAGEGMRELAKGEELDPVNIGIAAGTGGAITGGLAKLFGKAQAPKPAASTPAATGWSEPTAEASAAIEARHRLPDDIPVLKPDVKKALEQEFGMPQDPWTKVAKVKPAGPEQLIKAQELARQEQLAADEIATAKTRLGTDMEVKETAGESFSRPVPGGRERLTRTFRQKKAEPGDGSEPDVDMDAGPTAPLAKALGVKKAGKQPKYRTLDEAAQALLLKVPTKAPVSPVEPPILSVSPEVPSVAPIAPEAVVAPPAVQDDLSKLLDEIHGPEAPADPLGLPSGRGTMPVGAVDEADPLDAWMRRPDAPPEPEAAASPLMGLLKGPADALGRAYNAANADPLANPLAVRQLGIGGARAAQEAGIPSKARPVGPEQLRKFLTGRVSQDISEQYGEATPPIKTIDELAAALGREPVTPPVAPVAQQAAEMSPADQEQVKIFEEFLNRMGKLGSNEVGAINPAILARLALGTGGAFVGAAVDPLNDPLASGVVGGVAGFASPSLLTAFSKLGINSAQADELVAAEGVKSVARKVLEVLPHYQRFSYLASVPGIAANAIAGPWGSAMMGAVEHALVKDPRGSAAMKLLTPTNWFKEFLASYDDAGRLIAEGNTRWTEGAPVANQLEAVLAFPGRAMTMGDLASRRILMLAGFTDEEARQITLTSEPFSRLGRSLVNISKSGPIGQLLLPFSRTPVNIGEQGALRTPILGSIVNRMSDNPAPPNVEAIRQLLGAGVGTAGYAVGANVDPESSRNVRRVVTNLGGQYSLPAGIGFAAGQAVQRGKPAVTGAIQQAGDILPVPTFQPFIEWMKFATGEGKLPQGAVPSAVRPYLVDETPKASIGTIGRRPGLRRKQ